VAKRLRCEAITKKGKRCKNRSKGNFRCHVHAGRTNEKTVLQKSFEAVKVTTTTATAIKLIYTVLHYLITHWNDINYFFHGLDTNRHLNYWNMYKDDCSRVLSSWRRATEQEANDLVIEFNAYFPTLPYEVQEMVFHEIGRGRTEIGRRRLASLTQKRASLS
jgi:hypothetical protein